jgi:hypothetical protein
MDLAAGGMLGIRNSSTNARTAALKTTMTRGHSSGTAPAALSSQYNMDLDVLIDRISNRLINRRSGEQWLRMITRLRYGLFRHLYRRSPPLEHVIVSLTSHPPRYAKLGLTLRCLLSQSHPPSLVILWVFERDFEYLPNDILNLQSERFRIETTKQNYKSYTKILPAAQKFPDAVIVTADDDIFYNATWLSQLLLHFSPDRREVLGHRAHRITTNDRYELNAYQLWDWKIRAQQQPMSGFDVFLTGVSGTLYPPGSLESDMLDPEKFLGQCTSADDVWLYFLTTGNNYIPTVVPSTQLEYTWKGSQSVALKFENVDNNRNDEYMRSLSNLYGQPWIHRTSRANTKPTESTSI